MTVSGGAVRLPIYQLDAFSDRPFAGNPAAVMPLKRWLPDRVMQAIAAENNLAETAFFVPHPDQSVADYHLRWFTPTVEVDLCGHATLATAAVVFRDMMPDAACVRFDTMTGVLTVARDGDKLVLDFPTESMAPIADLTPYSTAFGQQPIKAVRGVRDDVIQFGSADDIAALDPDLSALRRLLPTRGFVATAKGCDRTQGNRDGGVDFVTRCFFPNHGIDEDSVTGSAYCIAAPFWAAETGKAVFHARQISARGGDLWLVIDGPRLKIAGHVAWVLEGHMTLPAGFEE